MNKHILLVMKWLKAPDSVTQEELLQNRTAAAYAAAAAADAADASYASKWVAKYFERTGESRQSYEATLALAAEDDLTNVIADAPCLDLNIADSRAIAAVIAEAGYHL